jgi:uncharacterized protein (DUF433 family)
MNAVTELLKPSEAAVVSCVRLRDVNRVIDEGILPDTLVSRNHGRLLFHEACTYIAFYFASADRLTSEERVNTIHALWNRHAHKDVKPSNVLDRDWIMRDEFLCIDLRGFAERSIERLGKLEAARARVTVSDDVLGGTPVFRGTRIPVHEIAALRGAGVAEDEILEDYPSLDADSLELATIYAEANPLRGRPRPLLGNLPEGTRVRSERRVRRDTRG